jgi:hypothetical protein
MNGFGTRDERESGIDRAADRLAFLVVSYGLLVIVAWRSLVRGEAAWELLALVVIGGVVGTVYRFANGALTRSWLAPAVITALAAMAVAALVAFATRA